MCACVYTSVDTQTKPHTIVYHLKAHYPCTMQILSSPPSAGHFAAPSFFFVCVFVWFSFSVCSTLLRTSKASVIIGWSAIKNHTIWMKNTVQHRFNCLSKCVCVSLPLLLWSWSVHQSPERVSARHLAAVCFTLPLFVCVFVCVLVQASVSLHFLPTIVCVEARALAIPSRCLPLSLLLSLSLISVLLGRSPRP